MTDQALTRDTRISLDRAFQGVFRDFSMKADYPGWKGLVVDHTCLLSALRRRTNSTKRESVSLEARAYVKALVRAKMGLAAGAQLQAAFGIEPAEDE